MIVEAAVWITDGDLTMHCNDQRGLLSRAQYLVSEALPLFLHRIATLRVQTTLSAEDTVSPMEVINYAIGELGDGNDLLEASERCLLRKVNYMLTEVLGVDL